eukprot:m.49525 g.49525  ORF g.49525 m.49525 type:complete len:254 (+) comp8963_c0_seq3:1566-2327(+)
MEDKQNVPKSIDVVIIPVAFKKNNELGACLDRAREAKSVLASAKLSCWTDMRRTLTPSAKYQEWEGKGVSIRVEIGAKELSTNTVVVADLVNKVRHSNGRMIASRTSVTLDKLAELVTGIAEQAKQGKRRHKGKEPEGNPKWGALLDMIDKEADKSTLVAAAAAAAADAPAAAPKGQKAKKSDKDLKKKTKSDKAKSKRAESKTSILDFEGEEGTSKGEKRAAAADEDVEGHATEKKRRRKHKKKKTASGETS